MKILLAGLMMKKVFVSLSERKQTKYFKIFIGKNNCIINNSTKKMFRKLI